jgi:hypothetical protein
LNSLGIRVCMIDMSLANENDKGSDASEEKDAGNNGYTDEDVPSRGLGGEASEKDTRQDFASNVTMEILVELRNRICPRPCGTGYSDTPITFPKAS